MFSHTDVVIISQVKNENFYVWISDNGDTAANNPIPNDFSI
jgi:hypothetical protein